MEKAQMQSVTTEEVLTQAASPTNVDTPSIVNNLGATPTVPTQTNIIPNQQTPASAATTSTQVSPGLLGGSGPKGSRRFEGGGGPNIYQEEAPLVSSWENTAEKQAGAQFQQNIIQGRQTSVKGRSDLDAAGQEAQTQLALGEYMRAQSAEKAGWTGGYMLDQRRQGEYLRASIQAQMYGAQELQRYGIETQLEAARLAYDLGKEQLAYQLYQQEQQKALTEAQMFGYYVSPEIKDMMNQLRAAQGVITDGTTTEAERERAQGVVDQINEWFGDEIDPNDIKTFSQITMEREQWNQAKLDAALASINDDPSTFIARDNQGRYVTDINTGQYVKVSFEDISADDLKTFLSSDDESTTSKFADQAVRSYLNYLGKATINSYFTSLKTDQTASSEGFASWITNNPNQMFDWLTKTFGTTDVNEIKAIVGGDKFVVGLTGSKGSVSAEFDLKTKTIKPVAGGTTPTQPTTTEPNTLDVPTGPTTVDPETQTISYENVPEPFNYQWEFIDFGTRKNLDNIPDDKANIKSWGVNENFFLNINKPDGSKNRLEFELGNHIGAYFGVFGIDVKMNALTFRIPTSLDGSKDKFVSHDELFTRVKQGEFMPVNISGYGANRNYIITKVGNFLRIVEAAAGKGKDHISFLKSLGYTEEYAKKFQFVNA